MRIGLDASRVEQNAWSTLALMFAALPCVRRDSLDQDECGVLSGGDIFDTDSVAAS